jgi:hypothetical protein
LGNISNSLIFLTFVLLLALPLSFALTQEDSQPGLNEVGFQTSTLDTYYWRVRAKNSGGATSSWVSRSFTVDGS